jgi:two-component system, NarL family, response regulator LiaR
VEEQEIYKDLYNSIFEPSGPFEVIRVDSQRDHSQLSQEISEYSPDVLIYSAKEIGQKSLEILQEVRLVLPKIPVLVASFHYHTDQIRTLKRMAAGSAGAGMALLLKNSLDNAQQFHAAVRATMDGQLIIDTPLTSLMFSDGTTNPIIQALTTREMEIIDLLAKGYTNSAIADTLFIGVRTVHHHINNLYNKLKEAPGFDNANMRVSATRIYLESRGRLLGGD